MKDNFEFLDRDDRGNVIAVYEVVYDASPLGAYGNWRLDGLRVIDQETGHERDLEPCEDLWRAIEIYLSTTCAAIMAEEAIDAWAAKVEYDRALAWELRQ